MLAECSAQPTVRSKRTQKRTHSPHHSAKHKMEILTLQYKNWTMIGSDITPFGVCTLMTLVRHEYRTKGRRVKVATICALEWLQRVNQLKAACHPDVAFETHHHVAHSVLDRIFLQFCCRVFRLIRAIDSTSRSVHGHSS